MFCHGAVGAEALATAKFMRHLRRIMINATTVGSLLMLMAVAWLWFDTRLNARGIEGLTSTGRWWLVSCHDGKAELLIVDQVERPLGGRDILYRRVEWLGIEFVHRYAADINDGTDNRGWRISLWYPALLFGILPGLRLGTWLISAIRRRRSRRAKCEGECLICGYDLRGTPERCPECGTIPES